jgi:hypothetical protein
MNFSQLGKTLSLTAVLVVSARGAHLSATESANTVAKSAAEENAVLASDVEWTPLNPLRGDKAPKAATLWGDRSGTGPSGFLVRFADGFSSPPHIHNVTYRGVVISGLVHNDDPDAVDMWMPAGSFWTQPAGEVHITAAKGSNSVAYIEIEQASYLVLPPNEAFDVGSRPINVHASNIVWTDLPGVPASATPQRVAFLWGDPQDGQPHGMLVKLPAGYHGELRSDGACNRAVVITGQIGHQLLGGADMRKLEPGSYFSSSGNAVHRLSCDGADECIIYMRTDGSIDLASTTSKN